MDLVLETVRHADADAIRVHDNDVATLRGWTRSSAIRAGLAQRARIVLLSGEGLGTTAVAERVGVSRPTVILWRTRYRDGGVDALADLPRPGRRSDTDEAAIVVRTLAAHRSGWGSGVDTGRLA